MKGVLFAIAMLLLLALGASATTYYVSVENPVAAPIQAAGQAPSLSAAYRGA